jgi:hypothetical protein
MTESEENLINLFSTTRFELLRVSEGVEKSPDFFIQSELQDVYIEVKEISENKSELELRKKVELTGSSGCYESSEVGKRFRTKIVEANRQLKKKCTGNQASIVIIQDIRPFISMSIMPQEEIKQAMFGDRVTWISVDNHEIAADLFSKNKTTTAEKNTTTSAVGLLVRNLETSELSLDLFHNPYAKNRLIAEFSLENSIREYMISDTVNYQDFLSI